MFFHSSILRIKYIINGIKVVINTIIHSLDIFKKATCNRAKINNKYAVLCRYFHFFHNNFILMLFEVNVSIIAMTNASIHQVKNVIVPFKNQKSVLNSVLKLTTLKYKVVCTIDNIHIHIPISFLNNISFCGMFNKNTFDNIGNHKIIHNNQIAISQDSFIVKGVRMRNKLKNASINIVSDMIFLCFIIHFEIVSHILKNDNIDIMIKKGMYIFRLLIIKIIYKIIII